jgi:hypothetical protein
MSKRPNFASVTDVPCTCGSLSASANDPDVPIIFDAPTGEYQFAYGGSRLIIYHCPFCGGAAPASRRPLLFAVLPEEERRRLNELLSPLQAVADAIAQLGKPDRDDSAGKIVYHPEAEKTAPKTEHFRTLLYEKLSTTADVHITERRDGSVTWHLSGKYLGAPPSDAQSSNAPGQ